MIEVDPRLPHLGRRPRATRGNIDALVGLVVDVGRLAEALGDRLEELDCNPVVVTPDGAHVVDSLVVLAADPAERTALP